MDGEAQVAKAVVAEHIVPAGDDEDAVAPEADLVGFDHRARRVPDADAVAALAHLHIVASLDPVVANDRGLGPFQVDADQVALDQIVLDHGACGAGGHEDAAVLDGEIAAGAGDRHPAQHHLRRVDGDHAPGPTAVENRSRLALQRQGAIHDDRPLVTASRQHEAIPRGRGGERRRERARLGSDLDRRRSRVQRCPEQGDDRGAPADRPWWHGRHAAVGSTSIRPFISMCMAWQNHWQ